jgi:hypothetical protein
MVSDRLAQLREERRASFRIATVVVVCGMLAFHILWLTFSWYEAQAYNRITGSQVTTWDAMFVDLRVQAEPKK